MNIMFITYEIALYAGNKSFVLAFVLACVRNTSVNALPLVAFFTIISS